MNPNPLVMTMAILMALIASCSHSGPGIPALNANTTNAQLHKVEGPPVDRLSSDQLDRIDDTCFAFHDLTDARVSYTEHYCERIDQERNARSMLAPHAKVVDPRPVTLH